jgi:hypothetical protein
MLAIGNDELGGPLGPSVECPHCGQQHAVEDSGPSTSSDGTSGPAGLLQFYRCPKVDKTFLCGIERRSIMHVFERRGKP